jgi:GNAT superfamily N-acetyltransferase
MSKPVDRLEIRLIGPDDPIHDLTLLLNRAYKRLADMGLKYVATWQGDDITLRRIKEAECWLGFLDGALVAAVSLRGPTKGKGSEWYSRPDVATFNQFAVKPELQGQGIGSKLLDHIEKRAEELGAAELALDTAEPAVHLIEFYEKRGYRSIEKVDWDVTNYVSVIMSKTLIND